MRRCKKRKIRRKRRSISSRRIGTQDCWKMF